MFKGLFSGIKKAAGAVSGGAKKAAGAASPEVSQPRGNAAAMEAMSPQVILAGGRNTGKSSPPSSGGRGVVGQGASGKQIGDFDPGAVKATPAVYHPPAESNEPEVIWA